MTRIRIPTRIALCALLATGVLAGGSTAADTRLHAFMDGASVVPGPGDPDGHARLTLTLRPSSRRVCYDLRKTKLETVQGLHIHVGRTGTTGGHFVDLITAPKGAGRGRITGCARDVPPRRIAALRAKPGNYYANLHTRRYPDGAVRGQLSRRGP
jgi:hypothetical protein